MPRLCDESGTVQTETRENQPSLRQIKTFTAEYVPIEDRVRLNCVDAAPQNPTLVQTEGATDHSTQIHLDAYRVLHPALRPVQ